MSYQNEEFLVAPTPQFKKKNVDTNSKWKYLALFSGVAATSLFAYSTTNFSSSSTSKNIMLAKEGAMSYTDLPEDDQATLFKSFKSQFSKSYETEEEEQIRYENFKTFLSTIDKRNDNEEKFGRGTANHGVTKFADLTEDEFKTHYLGFKDSDASRKKRALSAKTATVPKYSGSSTIVNWADIYTTSVKDQGYCGSCWAFSATEQIESDSIRLGLLTTSDALSPEQIVQCDTTNWGCDGGNTDTAFDYIKSTGGIEYSSDYPYTSYWDVTGTCSVDSSKFVVTVDSYYSVSSEDDMESYVLSTGPLSICVAASTWSSYTSGIISTCSTDVDHCVQAVGINTDDNYWVVRNSWGTEWGLEGYIYVESGKDLCEIAYSPYYTTTATA